MDRRCIRSPASLKRFMSRLRPAAPEPANGNNMTSARCPRTLSCVCSHADAVAVHARAGTNGSKVGRQGWGEGKNFVLST